MRERAIVVGADGAEAGMAAVEWAAREALRRQRPLRVVHTYEWDWRETRFDIGNEYIDVSRMLAEAASAAANRQARTVAPIADIESDILVGRAIPRLLEMSRGAELLVVGCHTATHAPFGSVSRNVATHARCPVVVVRGRRMPGGPVVAGVNDPATFEHVLAVAFDAATARGCGLVVLRAGQPAVRETSQARLAEQLAPWREKYPGAPVDIRLTANSADSALIDASARAQLVIIGARRHHHLRGLTTLSTTARLLHQADCPLYIARPLPAEET
jgi:nucleotide-binding universal stress UspA family protein